MPIGTPGNLDDDLLTNDVEPTLRGRKLLIPYTSAQIEDIRNSTRSRAEHVMQGI